MTERRSLEVRDVHETTYSFKVLLSIAGLLLSMAVFALISFWGYSLGRTGHFTSDFVLIQKVGTPSEITVPIPERSKLRVVNDQDDFAKILLAHGTGSEAEFPVLMVFQNGAAASQTMGAAAVAGANERIFWGSASERTPYIPIACAVGLFLGLLLPARRHLTPYLIAGLGLISLVKFLTTCASCSMVTLLGVDPAVLGVVFFAAIFPLASANRGRFAEVSALMLTIPIAWQLFASTQVSLPCLACGMIALLSTWLITSSPKWERNTESSPASPRQKLLFYAGTLVLPLIVILGTASSGSVVAEASTLATKREDIRIQTVADLGLPSFGKKTVLYIGRQGCEACALLLKSLDTIGVKGITYSSTSPIPPDQARPWLTLSRSDRVSGTPTIVFVDPKGKVLREVRGYSANLTRMQELSTSISTFLSTGAQQHS